MTMLYTHTMARAGDISAGLVSLRYRRLVAPLDAALTATTYREWRSLTSYNCDGDGGITRTKGSERCHLQ